VPPAISALVRISGRVISEPAPASDARDSSSVVERRLVAPAPLAHRAPDRAEHRLVADRAQALAHVGGERRQDRFVAHPEVIGRRCEARREAPHQVRGRRGGGRLEQRVGAALGLRALGVRDQLAGGARLGRGVGDALGEHLVVVDRRAVLRDLAGAGQGALQQHLGGSEQRAGVVEGRQGGVGHRGLRR
jgi:hypothetical protein